MERLAALWRQKNRFWEIPGWLYHHKCGSQRVDAGVNELAIRLIAGKGKWCG